MSAMSAVKQFDKTFSNTRPNTVGEQWRTCKNDQKMYQEKTLINNVMKY